MTEPFKSQFRSIKVPSHRITPLKSVWIKVYTPIVEQCHLEVRMNLRNRSVDIRTCADTPNTGLLQKAADFVSAVVAGFDVQDAMVLIRMDDIYMDYFEIKDVRANLAGDNLSRCIGRISGSHGKTKYTIENVTRTRIVLADRNIYILGTVQNTRIARDAICDLIRGSPAAKVYIRIRTIMNRVNDTL